MFRYVSDDEDGEDDDDDEEEEEEEDDGEEAPGKSRVNDRLISEALESSPMVANCWQLLRRKSAGPRNPPVTTRKTPKMMAMPPKAMRKTKKRAKTRKTTRTPPRNPPRRAHPRMMPRARMRMTTRMSSSFYRCLHRSYAHAVVIYSPGVHDFDQNSIKNQKCCKSSQCLTTNVRHRSEHRVLSAHLVMRRRQSFMRLQSTTVR